MTVGELFKKRGLVRARHRRIRLPPRTQPFEAITAPNDTWCTDFKGEFRVGDGETCYPLCHVRISNAIRVEPAEVVAYIKGRRTE